MPLPDFLQNAPPRCSRAQNAPPRCSRGQNTPPRVFELKIHSKFSEMRLISKWLSVGRYRERSERKRFESLFSREDSFKMIVAEQAREKEKIELFLGYEIRFKVARKYRERSERKKEIWAFSRCELDSKWLERYRASRTSEKNLSLFEGTRFNSKWLEKYREWSEGKAIWEIFFQGLRIDS